MMRRWVWLGVSLVVWTGLSTVSCGDDETGSGGSGNSGNTGGTTSMGGSDGGSASSGGGGTASLACDADAKCKSSEPCGCDDCWLEPECNSQPNCTDDGQCTVKEGCFCADCAGLPECADYCIDCHQYLTFFSDASSICEAGGSKQLYDALDTCACTSICVTECSTTLCNGMSPSQVCSDCIAMACQPEWDACFADVKPDVRCNPVTSEPCNATADQEHCDRVVVGDKIAGFHCFLRAHDALLCDACNYNFGGDYCARGHTCGDGLGDVALTGTCGRYCCDDGDCGTGTCLKGVFADVDPDLGICETQVGGPGCDAPAAAPSLGSCVALTP